MSKSNIRLARTDTGRDQLAGHLASKPLSVVRRLFPEPKNVNVFDSK